MQTAAVLQIPDILTNYGEVQNKEAAKLVVGILEQANTNIAFPKYIDSASTATGIALRASAIAGVVDEELSFQENQGFYQDLGTYLKVNSDLIRYGLTRRSTYRNNVVSQYAHKAGRNPLQALDDMKGFL